MSIDDETVDFLAWYMYCEGNDMDDPATARDVRDGWCGGYRDQDRRQQQYRDRAATYLRVAQGVGDGKRPPSRCGEHDERLISVCYLAPGHRGDQHRAYSGRTWPISEEEAPK
jgi:hypothetical protein